MSELIDKQAALDLVRDKCLEILDRCDSHYDVDVEDYVYDDPAIFNTILTCNKEIRNALSEMPTIDAVPLSAVRKAAKKLAYIHQQIDLYGDRPDLHDEEYWLEYLMDEEWKDEEID